MAPQDDGQGISGQAYADTYTAIGCMDMQAGYDIQTRPADLRAAFVQLARERGLMTEETP